MQRQCPDCKGHKTVTVHSMLYCGLMTVSCRTCGGKGIVHSKRPHKHSYKQNKPKRAKTPSYIKERREEERKFKQAMRGYLR